MVRNHIFGLNCRLSKICLFSGLIANFEEKVQSLIVPAVLEHEEIPGISGNKQSGFRTRSSSLREIDSPDGGKQKPTEALLEQLNSHYKVNTPLQFDLCLF